MAALAVGVSVEVPLEPQPESEPDSELHQEPQPEPEPRQPEPEPEPEPPCGIGSPAPGADAYRGVAEVRSGVGVGRYMSATAPLPAGQAVCAAPCFVLCVMESWKKRVCACCFGVADGRLSCRCEACGQAFYCDERCRASHALSGRPGAAPHAEVCPALARFSGLKKWESDTAVLRLLLEVLAHNREPAAECSAAADAAARFEALDHHPEVLVGKEARDWAMACKVFSRAVEACDWCPWGAEGKVAPTAGELQLMVSRIDSNCFGCFSNDGSGPPFARGVFLEAAMFNHACAPNCAASNDKETLTVYTTRPVAAGEELSIAYTDVNQPVSARRKALKGLYHFECSCARCVVEAGGGGAGIAARGSEKLRYSGGGKVVVRTKKEQRARREARAAAKKKHQAGSAEDSEPAAAAPDDSIDLALI